MGLLIIAGPCAVENEQQIIDIAKNLKELNIDALRGGAFKPRTDADAFQGHGENALKYLQKAKEETNLQIVTEVMGTDDIDIVSKYADFLQIGARNMHNYDLLKKLGAKKLNKGIILKRGLSATKRELLGAISYLKNHGHKGEIIVCERGIRTFANGEYGRFTLDVNLIADLKNDSNFNHKVIVDPSHPAGRADLVANLAYAGIAAGADGAIIEVKNSEDHVPVCDAKQAITVEELKKIIRNIKNIKKILS